MVNFERKHSSYYQLERLCNVEVVLLDKITYVELANLSFVGNFRESEFIIYGIYFAI